MIEIKLLNQVGYFAENKDIAREIRLKQIMPALDQRENIILDFAGVDSATQSFMHALLSEVLRHYGSQVIEQIQFKSCTKTLEKIITLVLEYMQESLD